MSKSKFDFEAALSRSEQIATQIEQGKIGLEESIRQFEEGMQLIRRCRQVLNEAELRIQSLEAAGADESVATRDYPIGGPANTAAPGDNPTIDDT
ncbi:MAG: exodeoxyribonuclease VII small subunit [Phycisphaerae bacterium]|nr:exodeoxyribonuclease VII small subunit [Phycisphaerae bacterium]